MPKTRDDMPDNLDDAISMIEDLQQQLSDLQSSYDDAIRNSSEVTQANLKLKNTLWHNTFNAALGAVATLAGDATAELAAAKLLADTQHGTL